jgi:hypothetical protein
MRRYREEHAEPWLTATLKMMQDGATIDQELQRFLRREPGGE